MTETATTTETDEQTHKRPLLSAQNRKRLLIITFGSAAASLAMWLLLWLPANLAYGQVAIQDVLDILTWHSMLFNIAAVVFIYNSLAGG
jgi:hypothetical protein